MKKIGIDARFFGEAGPGRYVKNIVQTLEHLDTVNTYYIFLTSKNFDLFTPKNPRFVKVRADYPWYSFKEQIFFLVLLLKLKLDLLYVPHFNIPIFYPGKLVTAIADVIMHTYSTEEGTTLPLPYYKFKKIVYKIVVYIALLRSRKIIVPSNNTLNQIRSIYKNINPDKFVLAHEGVDVDLLSYSKSNHEIDIKKPYILYIGSMYKHKNVEGLVEMYEILKIKYNFEGKMVLVGKKDTFSQNISNLIESRKLSEEIFMPGQIKPVTDPETVSLRKNASVYVFPSFMEGFSLTPLEAMVFDIPCVISDIPCHREIYGDTALYFDPKRPLDMAEKVHMALSDFRLREDLVQRGNALLQKYSWNDTAQKTLDVFIHVLK